jgi:hypothetical protein
MILNYCQTTLLNLFITPQPWNLGFGPWTLELDQYWTMDYGIWTMEFDLGLWNEIERHHRRYFSSSPVYTPISDQ